MPSMDDKKKKLLADGALLISALIWGGDYIAVKMSLAELTPLYMTGLRFGAAFVIMLAVFWKRMRRVTGREVAAGVVVGVFMFGGFALQTIGMQYTTAGKSAFITSIYAIVLPFLVWIFYKRFPGWHVMIGASVCVAGVAVLSLDELAGLTGGDILTLGCAVFFALNILSAAHYVRTMDPVIITVVETGASALFAFIGAFIFERPFPPLGRTSVISLVYLIIFGTIGTHLLSNIALKHTPSVHAGIIFTTESVFAVLFAYLLLGEILNGKMLLGCVLILLAIVITELGGLLVKKVSARRQQ